MIIKVEINLNREIKDNAMIEAMKDKMIHIEEVTNMLGIRLEIIIISQHNLINHMQEIINEMKDMIEMIEDTKEVLKWIRIVKMMIL